MRFKLLLLLLFISASILNAQPYRNLLFSEVRMDDHHHSYVEICNMGNKDINLSEFEVGSISSWATPFEPGDAFTMLPDFVLKPNQTFVIATVRDWIVKMSKIDPEKFAPLTKDDIWRKADMQLHVYESPSEKYPQVPDSISDGANALVVWGGSYCFYLRHHFIDPSTMLKDSVVVDAVNGIFTQDDGTRPETYGPSDVAGVANATYLSILVRKYNVTKGSGGLEDWENTRGLDLEDSEWLPIPFLTGHFEPRHKAFWTVGEHGDFRLNAQTIKSKTINIDWDNKTMTAAWGVRNMDSIMNEFDYAPGVAWGYALSPSVEDSSYTSVRTGDELTLYATGNQLDKITFKLTALPPTNAENRVVPKMAHGGPGNWYTPYVVTEKQPGMDTIREVAYATRVDSLFKYLEKAESASWKINWIDGVERTEVKKGDILKVTAGNGSVKDYYINVLKYRPSHNANLSAITWPDVPEYYKGILGWVGDTIPFFSKTNLNYSFLVPLETAGIPALYAKSEAPNAKIKFEKAKTLAGSMADRTTKIVVTAEDDSVKQTYSIVFEKEKDLSSAKTFKAEPFISQFVFRANWQQNFLEIVNPGTDPLDLSRYCLVRSYDLDAQSAITSDSGIDDFNNRYNRYVPGYIWQDETDWDVEPSMLVKDVSVNPVVAPGDVFVIGWVWPNYENDAGSRDRLWENFDQIDVNFKNEYNPWGLTWTESNNSTENNVMAGWLNNSWLLYKITNDSVFNGLKPLNDPNDVELIDVIGRCTGAEMGAIEGQTYNQNSGLKRKPEVQQGNPIPGDSFGDGEVGTSEWTYTTTAYWDAQGFGWPDNNFMNSDGIGAHDFMPITKYYSTIASGAYIVSDGFSMTESIKGPEPGITVDEFLANIIKLDAGQVLVLKRGTTILTGVDLLENGDVLEVEAVAAEIGKTTKNKSAYIIDVVAGALNTNAVLSSSVYDISIVGNTGIVAGIAPKTSLLDAYNNVTAPATAAQFNVLYDDGRYAPFKMLTFDTTYVDVLATQNILFEVVAQDNVTKIVYSLELASSPSDAYVLSNVYLVDQDASTINMIPNATNAIALLNLLIPAPGATMELQNKMGQARNFGPIYKDDKLVVTSQDGQTQKTYSIALVNDIRNYRKAYLYSKAYTVNQKTLRINLTGTIAVSNFMDNVYTSWDGTYVIQSADGAVKTTGNIEDGDKVIVTSADGTNTKTYNILVKVGFENINTAGNINMYPNPTNGIVNISGIKAGNNIRVFNAFGRNIANFKASSESEAISLDAYSSGMYLITIDNGTTIIGKSKLIKK
ncbi:MAG TPA: T9SS type A sorting domain-containing protein [Prolixibacteraceae bacterium]|nr:T9SS type A sorting domain-containing protein [Prolixibacteraceae bacterium]